MARLKAEHLAELRRLHDESVALLDWLGSRGLDSAPAMKAALAEALLVQDLRGVREGARDVRQMLDMLIPEQRAAVFQEIEARTGTAIRLTAAKDERAALAVVERGKIQNDAEYYLLRGYVDQWEADPARRDEAMAAARLIGGHRVPGPPAT